MSHNIPNNHLSKIDLQIKDVDHVFLAMQSMSDSDPAIVRTVKYNIPGESLSILIEEDKSDGKPASHGKEKVGYVCGCPLANIGLEQSPQSTLIGENIQKCFGKTTKYFEAALKDAKDSGAINIKDVQAKANELYTYCLGALTQARFRFL